VAGEERSVELQADALAAAGVPHALLERDSATAGAARAAASLLSGGERPEAVARAARDLDASIVHFHSFQPLFGARAMSAARETGARVVVHLHNFRLFCAISVAFRDGAPCFRCRGRLTLPGVVLNCRGSVPEALAYGIGLARQQPEILSAADLFITPSRFAAGQLALLGLPEESVEPLPHYLPAERLAERSRAGEGGYAIAAGRFAPEKGFEVAIDAAAASGVPLKLAGGGPLEADLRRRAEAAGAPVEFTGFLPRERLDELMAGAAMALIPTVGNDVAPFAALEAMGAGLPVLAARSGGLPEIVGPGRCLPRGDAAALADRMRALWDEPDRRTADGGELLERVATEFSRERFTERLLALYDRL
jgi:glycosyltransferase involved in cell wall biosynthesis